MKIDLRPPVYRGVRASKVDYVAFTIPSLLVQEDETGGRWPIAYALVMDTPLGRIEDEETRTLWHFNKGRGFYRWMCHNLNSNLTVHWGGNNSHVYVECTGQTCEKLRLVGVLDDLIKSQLTTLSRIDLCSDLNIEDKPSDFVKERENRRIKAESYVLSSEGETVYIGSRKNERYARVYRYHEPHPRAPYLRVEHVFHGASARSAAATLLDEGLPAAIEGAGRIYGWSHQAWKDSAVEATKIPAAKYDRQGGGTIRWLYTTVPQALLQSHAAGLIDLRSWYEKFLKSTLEGQGESPLEE